MVSLKIISKPRKNHAFEISSAPTSAAAWSGVELCEVTILIFAPCLISNSTNFGMVRVAAWKSSEYFSSPHVCEIYALALFCTRALKMSYYSMRIAHCKGYLPSESR